MRNKKIDSDQSTAFREIGGLSFASAADILAHRLSPLDPADRSPLADSIRKQWPDADASYWGMVARRYRELFKNLPEADAVKAVRANFSSPFTAMVKGAIRRRRYIGFEAGRAS